MSDDSENPSIKVSDRRRFSADGEPLDQEETAATEESVAAETTDEPAEERESAAKSAASPPPLPAASFELLVMSLGVQAQMELTAPNDDNAPPPNLDMARHTIDLLAVLKEKTKGNLSLEESRRLDNTLTELRFRYVQRVNEINEKAKG
ncbi:MAG: DUF1844 domain-containing protein [Bryobacterales bacterium]|nr:DUF1844 domain-containing protein [Bryobacterales bacterium]MDE0293763.1 DUF1844 domain-containing protein [Bryobacterales bacterium]